MNLVYKVNEKPKFGKNIIYAFQQLLAIMAATLLVPILANVNAEEAVVQLSQSSALMGAGVGTLVYIAFTRMKSPVFLGSSFAFIMPLATALTYGYCGIILGSIFAGLVYVGIAIVIKFVGAKWIEKMMPPVIIGPTVALIGLSLSGSAIKNVMNVAASSENYNLVCILIGIVTFLVTVVVSVKGSTGMKLIPFVIGVLSGYALAVIITLIGYTACGNEYFNIVNFEVFKKITTASNWIPDITFIGAIKEIAGINGATTHITGAGVVSLLVAFAPVALVVFAEHVADHKNISSIIESNLLEDPGLDKTLLGDGVGSIAGAMFGGCPNTTYGESIGCVAITGNASVWTIITTAFLCIILAFFYPFVLFVESIPTCVVGGISIALYGFIAVSGLRMFKHVDLDNSKNLFVVSSILVTGIGGLTITFGKISITSIACALILGIIVNLILKPNKVSVEKIVKPVDKNKVEKETIFGTVLEDEEPANKK